MGSTTPTDQLVCALVSIITALTSAVTAASTSGSAVLSLASLATSIDNQGNNDAGMTAIIVQQYSVVALAISFVRWKRTQARHKLWSSRFS